MAILDQYGNPISIKNLREAQTAGIAALAHARIESHLAGLTPQRAANILRRADDGDIIEQQQLFADMYDRDAHILCESDKRTGAVQGLDWQIMPPKDATPAEKQAAETVADILMNAVDDLEDVVSAMMEGVGHGFAAIEMSWQYVDGLWLPRFQPQPQTWFQVARDGRTLNLRDGSAEGASLWPFGWIFHQHRKVKTGYVGRMGMARVLVWPFIYKNFGLADFSELLETYGLPFVIGKYMAGATEAEQRSLSRAVAALGHDARAIMPQDMEIELKTVSGSGGDLHLRMAAWADAAISKAILGQTLSATPSATGLGSGVAQLQGEVRDDIRDADAKQIADTLTRDLVYPLVVLNTVGIQSYTRCPRWVFNIKKNKNLQLLRQPLSSLVKLGVRIPVSWANEQLGIPEPVDGEEILRPMYEDEDGDAPVDPEQTPVPAATRRAALSARTATPDAMERLTAALAAQADPLVAGWVEDLQRWLDSLPDDTPLAEVQKMLLDKYGDLPTEKLVEVMAQAVELATLAGMGSAGDDHG